MPRSMRFSRQCSDDRVNWFHRVLTLNVIPGLLNTAPSTGVRFFSASPISRLGYAGAVRCIVRYQRLVSNTWPCSCRRPFDDYVLLGAAGRADLLRERRRQPRQAHRPADAGRRRATRSNQAEASYRVGLATNLERLAAENQLLDAELQLASEQFVQALLLLDLTRFTGRLVQTTPARRHRHAAPAANLGGTPSLRVGVTAVGTVTN